MQGAAVLDRYGATKTPQALFWLGGMGSTAPQLWLRAEPTNNRLIATMTTVHGSASLSSTQPYDDQTWHHIALQRSAGQLLLWVDGTQRLHGTLDEARLYTRALSTSELDQIRLHNADVRTGQVLRLPFDKIRQGHG